MTLGPNGQPADGEVLDFEKFSASEITIQLHTLALIGDTAPAGDLTVGSRALQYSVDPRPDVGYPSAPPGLYSRYEFNVERTYAEESIPDGFMGQRLSVRVVGKAHLQGKDRDFVYADDQLFPVSLEIEAQVLPGVPGRVSIGLDVQNWFNDVDWVTLDDEAGGGNAPIIIGMGGDEGSPSLANLRNRLPGSFRVRDE